MSKNLRNMMVLAFVALFFILLPNKVFAAANIERFGGATRYDTSIQISKFNWTNSDYVIIATGEDFPDALCATPLAKKYNAPILLINGNTMTKDFSDEISRLKVKNAFIIGGTGAVSGDIDKALTASGISVTRIAGTDRFDTSLKIAQQLGPSQKIALATGLDFPDALSISVPAAKEGMPILLTNTNSTPDNIKNYINTLKPSTIYCVGGTGVITDSVLQQFQNTKRLAGSDRIGTNLAVLKEFDSDFQYDSIFLGTAYNFPDVLSGSAAAALTSSPVMLVDPGSLAPTSALVTSKFDNINHAKVLGGTGVMPDDLVSKLVPANLITVMIDPGHGGYDSGAIGPTGVKEKDVTLAIALKLGPILQASGIKVVYTRTSDNVSWPSNNVTQDLQTRCDMASAAKANYFISIHCNSSTSSAPYGTETYSSAIKNDAVDFAQNVQSSLTSEISSYDRGIKTANFYVLNNTSMPAILTEVGFISNSTEEKELNSPDYQNKIAEGIARGILTTINN